MNTHLTNLPSLAFGVLTGFWLAGCAGGAGDTPELAPVSGTVTLDGKPLADATVVFQPEEGSPSQAITDQNGSFELIYGRDKSGAKVGKHTVRITTYQAGMAEDGEGNPVPPVAEQVPKKYNENSELTRQVKPGGNVFKFELDSEGELPKPPAGEALQGY